MRHAVFAVLLAVALALSPAAFAGMGGGKSYGSRGSRTADRPMERSYTPPPPMLQAPAPASRSPAGAPPMAAAPAMGGGLFSGRPFLAGVLGGLTGFGLGGLLFGHSAMAEPGGMSPAGGLIGLLLQIALIVFVARWILRRLKGFGVPAAAAAAPVAPAPRAAREFEPDDADKQAFGAILVEMQQAWSSGDLARMRGLATPEVVSWLAEDLAADASRGVRNVVDEVRLLKGDVVEAWREGGRDFVTAALTFSARDYTLGTESGEVVEGDPRTAAETRETWTFVRADGGRWLLSAVER